MKPILLILTFGLAGCGDILGPRDRVIPAADVAVTVEHDDGEYRFEWTPRCRVR